MIFQRKEEERERQELEEKQRTIVKLPENSSRSEKLSRNIRKHDSDMKTVRLLRENKLESVERIERRNTNYSRMMRSEASGR